MKTYQTKINPNVRGLCVALQQKLPAKFNNKMYGGTNLNIVESGNSIEIWLPLPYEQYLYKIDVDGSDVNISKSEHYTDDANSLAMEDVLTDIVIAFIGKENIENLEPSTGN
ncbi:hypothetical protein BDD43_4457 [Mucilaginibacter gracilis]|uniref:Uncharacterized protein n=1 Tax=Mucilaginibacter gracilis TaxID=423350 RepID=A0A495J5S3_9SPHI|nr:hypothetical protein [Mucilaginibacter gracilis]RKR84227.1 hypothetical protein BDD43_4457 [Mucilaginibacter gracilis]